MADLVKTHLDDNVACSKQLNLRCPMCTNPTCGEAKEWFERTQGVLDMMKIRQEAYDGRQG